MPILPHGDRLEESLRGSLSLVIIEPFPITLERQLEVACTLDALHGLILETANPAGIAEQPQPPLYPIQTGESQGEDRTRPKNLVAVAEPVR